MLRYLIAYLVMAVVFFGADFVWLSRMMGFYKSELGDLLAERPNLMIAALFYAIYVGGVLVLAVLPAERSGSLMAAVVLGGVLGLVAYGTYDLTNLSTMRRWSVLVTVVDLCWGIVVTATSSLAGYAVLSALSRGD